MFRLYFSRVRTGKDIHKLSRLAALHPRNPPGVNDDFDLVKQNRRLLDLINDQRPSVLFKKQFRVALRKRAVTSVVKRNLTVFFSEKIVDGG